MTRINKTTFGVRMNIRFQLLFLISVLSTSCITVNDRPQEFTTPSPRSIIIKANPDCTEIADDFTNAMNEVGLQIFREKSATAYVQEAQQGDKYFAIVIKAPDDDSLEWNKILNGFMFTCTYKGDINLDVILKQ